MPNKIAKVVINKEERYVTNLWWAEDDVIGDCNTSNDAACACVINDRDLPYIVAFYAEYNIVVELIDEVL